MSRCSHVISNRTRWNYRYCALCLMHIYASNGTSLTCRNCRWLEYSLVSAVLLMLFFVHKLANAPAANLLCSLCLLACTISTLLQLACGVIHASCLLAQQLVCFNRLPGGILLQPQHTSVHVDVQICISH